MKTHAVVMLAAMQLSLSSQSPSWSWPQHVTGCLPDTNPRNSGAARIKRAAKKNKQRRK